MKNTNRWLLSAAAGLALTVLVAQDAVSAQQTQGGKLCASGCVGEEDFDVTYFTDGPCNGGNLSVTLDINNGTCKQISKKKCKKTQDCVATWIVDGSAFPPNQTITIDDVDYNADGEGNLLESGQKEVHCGSSESVTATACETSVTAEGECTACP